MLMWDEVESLMRRAVDILLRFKAATGHDHPNLSAATDNYRELLKDMGYNEDKITQKFAQLLTTIKVAYTFIFCVVTYPRFT